MTPGRAEVGLVSLGLGVGLYAMLERIRNHPEPAGNPYSDLPFDMRIRCRDVRWDSYTGNLVVYGVSSLAEVIAEGLEVVQESHLEVAAKPGAGDPGPGRPDPHDASLGGVGRRAEVEEGQRGRPTSASRPGHLPTVGEWGSCDRCLDTMPLVEVPVLRWSDLGQPPRRHAPPERGWFCVDCAAIVRGGR